MATKLDISKYGGSPASTRRSPTPASLRASWTQDRTTRNHAINVQIANIRKAKKVDFCIVMDCTGSMARHLAACSSHVLRLVEYVGKINGSVQVRWGFVGYRDHEDGARRLEWLDFRNDDGRAFRTVVGEIQAFGGGDEPEDVLGGLWEAMQRLSWSGGTKIIFHVGDAPPHGRIFTSGSDNYPGGDPNGLRHETVLRKMRSLGILYYFGSINNSTDRMIEIFQQTLGKITVFNVKSTQPQTLVDQFVKASSVAIAQSVMLTSTIAFANASTLGKADLPMDPNQPDNWKNVPTIKGTSYTFNIPKSMDKIMSLEYWTRANLISGSVAIKVAEKPFSKGVERYAYYGRSIKAMSKDEAVVLKKFADEGSVSDFERYLTSLEVQTIAAYMAFEFNRYNCTLSLLLLINDVLQLLKLSVHCALFPPAANAKKVKFLKARVIKTAAYGEPRYCSEEPLYRDANFKRFNCNAGVITEFHSTLEAFAHFTYQFTEGYLVVTDLQGAEYQTEFILTDPAILCVDNLRFGQTNLGSGGIKECFVANHRCNSVCQQLGLKVIGA
ncbi:kinase-like domain-containing protein [Jimgerdemannia flammicorona]|uniref:Kinase-like domain-containing protein n=1 Tax=Jimgerdemannia flammicorona TaxID=994334 RepID=A0A433DAP6_9FUNG|nr:kinase-like domain-containing protein [Jimgerdemannia flammicorona]